MSQELMDLTTKSTRLEREVSTLSMKLDDKKIKHKAEVAKLRDKIIALENESPLERIARRDTTLEDNRRMSELEEKNDHLKWLNTTLKEENTNLKGKVEKLKAKRDKSPTSSTLKSAKNNDKWRNVALQEQVAVLSQRVIELEEAASASASALRRPPQSPRPASILHSPVVRTPSSAPKSAMRVSTYDTDTNQANQDLLSNDDGDVQSTISHPPPLPKCVTPSQSAEKSKISKSSSSRFSLRKRSSKEKLPPTPKFDDMSNSTTNYDF